MNGFASDSDEQMLDTVSDSCYRMRLGSCKNAEKVACLNCVSRLRIAHLDVDGIFCGGQLGVMGGA